MPKLIGLNGKARSGKDTTANQIGAWCGQHEFTVAKQGFANKLKISAAHALGIFEDEITFCNNLKGDYERGSIQVRMANKAEGPNAVASQITGREFLQYYGTEAHRDVFGYDFWVDAILPKTAGKNGADFRREGNMASSTPIPDWHEFFQCGDGVADFCLVTDVRFDNEAQRIVELGGEVWKVVRDGSGAGEHASEMELPGEYINVVIDNNGSLNDLSESVDTLMADVSQLEAINNG